MSLQRGLGLLLLFSEERRLLGVADLADLAGLTRPTTFRYVDTLVQLGYLEHGRARKYQLAPRAADPGSEIVSVLRRVHRNAGRVLADLRNALGHTVSMGALDETAVLYIHRFFGHRRGQHLIDGELRVGAYIPAYCTALGKVLLASLPEAERHQRIAGIDLVPQGPHSITTHGKLVTELHGIDPEVPTVSDEESSFDARSIAVLVSSSDGVPPMAIDVTVPATAYTADGLLDEIGPALRRARKLIA
jgi:IclR family transcriptional regulator, pca regulon regulatory protein